MPSPRLNFCETNIMSVCNAIEKDMQKYCRFYDRSSYGDHCMFFHFDQYCDSPEAQKHASNLEKDHRQSLRKNKILSDCQPKSEIFNLDHKDASRLFSSETSVQITRFSDDELKFINLGTATEAKIPMIAITTIISTGVKPLSLFK